MASFSNALHWKKAICVWQILVLKQKKASRYCNLFSPTECRRGRKIMKHVEMKNCSSRWSWNQNIGCRNCRPICNNWYEIFLWYTTVRKKVHTAVLFSLFLNSGNKTYKFEVQNCKQRNNIYQTWHTDLSFNRWAFY